MSDENEMMTLHKESTLLKIAMWSKVVGWILLFTNLVSGFSYLKQILDASAIGQMPTDTLQLTAIYAQLLQLVATGAFYFLVAHGLAQGLYIALDLFAGVEEEDM